MKAVICPVCSGTGKYIETNTYETSVVTTPRMCHGCSGKGWVEVNETTPTTPTIYPQPIFPYYPYYSPIPPVSTTTGLSNPPTETWNVRLEYN